MRFPRVSTISAAAAFAAPIAAAAPGAGMAAQPGSQVILGGCRQGECGWLRIAGVTTVRTSPEGRLLQIVVRRGTSVHGNGPLPSRPGRARIAWDERPRNEYAFCSTRRPAYAFPDGDDGGLIVHFLDLFDLAGYQLGSGRLYMRFCHGRDGLPDPRRLRRLGYRPDAPNWQAEGQSVDALTRF